MNTHFSSTCCSSALSCTLSLSFVNFHYFSVSLTHVSIWSYDIYNMMMVVFLLQGTFAAWPVPLATLKRHSAEPHLYSTASLDLSPACHPLQLIM